VVQNVFIGGGKLAVILLSAILILTLLFGRLYCSTLCPLGVYQELLMILFKPFYKRRAQTGLQKHYVFSYIIMAVLWGTVVGGTVIFMRCVEPYAVAGSALSGTTYGLIFVLALAVLVFLKKRYFCTSLCPVGALLGLISRFSLFKIRFKENACKQCSLCAKMCPAGAIDYQNRQVNNETCIRCLKCLPHCRFGALEFGALNKPTVAQATFSLKRRELIKGGLLLLVFGKAITMGADFGRKFVDKIKSVILPAGSGNQADFSNRCLNCNLCVENCPAHIIKPKTDEVPHVYLDMSKSYCRYDCHKCSEVCPSGAIQKLSLKEKQKTKIATAVIDEDKCVKCGVCAMECPVKAIKKEGDAYPLVQFDKCLGCGKCANMCPVKAIGLEPVQKQVLLS